MSLLLRRRLGGARKGNNRRQRGASYLRSGGRSVAGDASRGCGTAWNYFRIWCSFRSAYAVPTLRGALQVADDSRLYPNGITSVPEKLAVAKKYVYDRLQDGRLRPRLAKTFSFSQTVDAYKYLESNAQVGKIVITVP